MYSIWAGKEWTFSFWHGTVSSDQDSNRTDISSWRNQSVSDYDQATMFRVHTWYPNLCRKCHSRWPSNSKALGHGELVSTSWMIIQYTNYIQLSMFSLCISCMMCSNHLEMWGANPSTSLLKYLSVFQVNLSIINPKPKPVWSRTWRDNLQEFWWAP